MNRRLLPTPAFLRAAKKYLKRSPQSAAALEATLKVLAENAFDARLQSHKLKGNLSGTWACSAGYNLRILFEFVRHENKEAILLLTVGTHDEVY